MTNNDQAHFFGILRAALRSIRMRGGGAKGLFSLMRRALTIIRALGVSGFVRWVIGSRVRQSSSRPQTSGKIEFKPSALEDVALNVGVMAHVYYADVLPELRQYLANIPVPFSLLVSVPDKQIKSHAIDALQSIPHVSKIVVRTVPNRGRDIAPLLVTFRDEIASTDVFCHIHTKKSLHAGHEQHDWRRYLFESLLGSKERVAWLLGSLHAVPDLGIVYPESFRSVPLSAHTWLGNADIAGTLGKALGVDVRASGYIDFPAGSMFWARTDSLRGLFDLGLTYQSFPEEEGQIDGTLHHAIERLFAEIVKANGQLIGVIPADGNLELWSSGGKNWEQQFSDDLLEKILKSSERKGTITFDVFDTLVVRPFLTPSGARDYLSHCVSKAYGIADFSHHRNNAEEIARAKRGYDPNIRLIYEQLATNLGIDANSASLIMDLELVLEKRLLTAREAALSALTHVASRGAKVAGISDMYLDESNLQMVLPKDVRQALPRIHVSCETKARKGNRDDWKKLADTIGADRNAWTHVGDNEHADVHCPLSAGLRSTVHILRPEALLQTVPAFFELAQSKVVSRTWQDDLAIGLIANELTSIVDSSPGTVSRTFRLAGPGNFGYLVLGPFLVDYLAWIQRTARREGFDKILFLAREGHLLKRGFDEVSSAIVTHHRIPAQYFLASRRAVGMASAESVDDLLDMLASDFDGTLGELVQARLGEEAADLLRTATPYAGTQVNPKSIRTIGRHALAQIEGPLISLAESERDAYLRYWTTSTDGCTTPLLADIGYAGTIQRHLSKLTQRTMHGAYFALRAKANRVPGHLEARYYDERTGNSTPDAVLRFDLLMEAVMTAPHPQFSHFRIDALDGTLVPTYVNSSHSTHQAPTIDHIHNGAIRFLRDVLKVVGEDIALMDLNATQVQLPLSLVGHGKWHIGKWANDLGVDDFYSGRGIVHPFNTRS